MHELAADDKAGCRFASSTSPFGSSHHMMSHFLGFLGRFAPQAMAAGVFIGLLAPWLADILRPLLTPAVWLLLVMSLLRVDIVAVVAQIRRPVLAIAVTIWMLILAPVAVATILSFVDFRPGIEAGIILSSASSALFSTPVLGVMFGLNGALLLVVLVAGTLIVPVTLPLAALFLLGFDMGADPFDLMIRMSILVLSALAAATLIKRVVGSAKIAEKAPIIDGWSVILLIIFAIAIMQGLTARLFEEPTDTLMITALSFASYVGLMVLGLCLFAPFAPQIGRNAVLSISFVSGTRNLAMILAVLPENVDPDIPLFFAVGQFPIYIMPMVLRPIINRLQKQA